MKKYFKYILTVVAAIGDIVTTVVAVNSGQAYEANPIARVFQENYGLVPANIVTGIIFVAYISTIFLLSEKLKTPAFKQVLFGTAYGILIFKCIVVTSNIILISTL